MDLYLIRHGESTGNNRQCFLGWGDAPLTDIGVRQAEAVATRLSSLGSMLMISSDLPRALHTAGIIAARWQTTVNPDIRWRETNCGRFEGLPWSAYSEDSELVKQFEQDSYSTVMPEGESVAMMVERVQEAFRELIHQPEPRIAVVTHDGPIRAVLAHCLQLPRDKFWTLSTTHGGFTKISVSPDWLNVRCVNDTGHLIEGDRS